MTSHQGRPLPGGGARVWPACRNPSCGKPLTRRADNRGWNGCRGWCSACAERWRVAGKPPGGPPAAPSGTERAERISAGLRRWHATHRQSQAARTASSRQRANRLQDYAWLVSFGEAREDAARRVGISPFTARDYERLLASRGGGERDEAA